MKKEIIITLIITVFLGICLSLYGVAILFGLVASRVNPLILFFIGGIFILLIGALIYTFITRIIEIKEEDKDDISKY